MSWKNEFDSTRECSVDLHLQIDEICDAFELGCQRNERPRIEDYLDETLGNVETQLAELVMVELAYRRKVGDTPTIDEYVTRFPNYSDVFKRLSDQFQVDGRTGYKTPPVIENLESFEFVGAGSFGSVWKAWDAKLLRFVAVKTPVRPVPTKSDRELIQREAQVVARVKHRHIVPVHYAGEKDGRVYVVYEFVAGMTLRDRMHDAPYTAKQAASLCAKVADAIHTVHELGIVHRDLKPANILIDQADEPYVMDFGLAKLLDAASTIGLMGNPLGTPAYMSPEQAAGRTAETDSRSDIYSLGVILQELLSAKPTDQGVAETIPMSTRRGSTLPLAPLTGLEPSLQRICSKCLENDKRDRYGSAAELAADLWRYVNDEPVQAHPVLRRTRFWRWLVGHWQSVTIVLTLTLPLFAFMIPERTKKESTSAVVPVEMRRTVSLVTEPEGAAVSVHRCNSGTGEPDLFNPVIGMTPAKFQLFPGRYLLHLRYSSPDGPRSHEVHRTVPGLDWPSMTADWEQYDAADPNNVKWPRVKIPNVEPLFEMVYFAGTKDFVVLGPDGPKTVTVAPFFVATKEFTFGDFLTLRPGFRGEARGRPAPEQLPSDSMPASYEWAEHWAEVAGCRLLTDLEFDYLASLADAAQSNRKLVTESLQKFGQAGGSTLDEIPTRPPIRGILTGYSEWTSTWPRSPQATAIVLSKVDPSRPPKLYRIIRGGMINCSPGDYPRNPDTADTSTIYDDHPHVGFRLARSQMPELNKPDQ